MHFDVHYYPAKFGIKLQLVYGEKKEKLCYGVKQTKMHSLGGKLNQVIVQGVMQTLVQLRGVIQTFYYVKWNMRTLITYITKFGEF